LALKVLPIGYEQCCTDRLRPPLTLDDVIVSRGGIPLIENGKIIGAIGCSGGTGSQDAAVCSIGADMVK
jgi:uncharacterized protein GlcG (DUF336 family)